MTRRTSSLAAHAVFAGGALHQTVGLDESDLRLLRMFWVVVGAGGLSAATVPLQVDLSTVSRQFKELEARFGVRLARRGRGGFSLTPAGEQLHAATRRLFDAIGLFRHDANALAHPVGPLLRLGVVDALVTAAGASGDASVSALLARCCAALPGLAVQMTTLRPAEIERAVLAGELDAGVLAAHRPAAGLEQHRLYGEPNSLFAAPGHPWYDSVPDAGEFGALPADGLVFDPYWGELPHPQLAGAAHGRTRADSIEGVALLVASGRFVGFLPDHLVLATATLAHLRRVAPERHSYVQDIVLTCRQGCSEGVVRELVRQALCLPAS